VAAVVATVMPRFGGNSGRHVSRDHGHSVGGAPGLPAHDVGLDEGTTMTAADPHAMTAKEHIDEAKEQLMNARVAGHGTSAMQEHTQLAIAHSTIAVALNTMAVALNTLPEPDGSGGVR
jgi:hypothetical protein